jgi:hypothetical protein
MTVPTPIHYWKCNENGGTVARDSLGGAHLTLNRGDCWVAGKVGYAIRFDPEDGVTQASTILNTIPEPWTVACWVQRTANSVGAALFSSKNYAVKLEQYNDTHQVGVTFCGTLPDHEFEYSTPIGQWVYLVLVATNRNQINLYVDGAIKATMTTSQPFELGLTWFGSKWESFDFASMLLEEVKVWDVALTDKQVKELGNGTGAGGTDGNPGGTGGNPGGTGGTPSTGAALAGYYLVEAPNAAAILITDTGSNTVKVQMTYQEVLSWSAQIVNDSQLLLDYGATATFIVTSGSVDKITVDAHPPGYPAWTWVRNPSPLPTLFPLEGTYDCNLYSDGPDKPPTKSTITVMSKTATTFSVTDSLRGTTDGLIFANNTIAYAWQAPNGRLRTLTLTQSPDKMYGGDQVGGAPREEWTKRST